MLKKFKLNGVLIAEYESDGNLERDAEITRQMLEERGLLKPFDRPLAIFSQAAAFANTAAYLYETGLKSMSAVKPEHSIPFSVNAAFAIELYLTARSEKHGKPLRGHDLKDLYNALPPEATNAIEKATPWAMEDRGFKDKPDLPAFLEALRNVFVSWRYSYENDKGVPPVTFAPTIFAMAVLHGAWQGK